MLFRSRTMSTAAQQYRTLTPIGSDHQPHQGWHRDGLPDGDRGPEEPGTGSRRSTNQRLATEGAKMGATISVPAPLGCLRRFNQQSSFIATPAGVLLWIGARPASVILVGRRSAGH